jgi:nucleotide-binding universal stress UspA family protein
VTTPPVVVGVPLDDTMHEVASAAVAIARRLQAPLLPVHAIPPALFPNVPRSPREGQAAGEAVLAALAAAPGADRVTILAPSIAEANATPWLLQTADRAHAQMIVVGGGHGPTVGGWLLGTVADRVVRAARCPVLVARGAMPGPDRPILCPVDLTPHSHLGLEEALRFARHFEAPLRVLTVLPRVTRGTPTVAQLDEEAARLERATREELAVLLRAHDTRDVAVEVRVVAGDPASEILDAASRAYLVVLASRSFDMLVPASLGDVASRVLREARCGVLAVRDLDPDVESRTKMIAHVVSLRDESRRAIGEGDLSRAERALRVAQTILPGHAALHDDLAAVLDRAGRAEEAERHRAAARVLRSFHE